MTTLREAAQQALTEMANARDYIWLLEEGGTGVSEEEMLNKIANAITALHTALAEEALQRLTDVSQEIEAALAEPVQKPLTEDEIDGLVIQHAGYGQDNFYAVTRAIERAHGIKE